MQITYKIHILKNLTLNFLKILKKIAIISGTTLVDFGDEIDIIEIKTCSLSVSLFYSSIDIFIGTEEPVPSCPEIADEVIDCDSPCDAEGQCSEGLMCCAPDKCNGDSICVPGLYLNSLNAG